MKKLQEMIYYYGFQTGIALVIAPIAYDILWIGGREALLWSIGVRGMAIQLIGLALMFGGGRDSK